MVENKSGRAGTEDDLDLINLLESVFSFLTDNGRRLAIFSVAGMLAGFALYMMSPKLYASTLLLHSSTLTNTEQINIIDNWNALLKNGEYEELRLRLNADSGIFKQVANISAAEIQKSYIPNNPNAFVVSALVRDNAVLDSLGKAIVYGFENNDYIKAKLASRRSNLSVLIDKIKVEISKLDSVKKNIEASINSNSLHTSSFIIDISAINGQVIGLNEKLLAYQDELKFSNAVEVFHTFEKFKKPVGPKMLKSVVLGFIAGFTMGYLLSLYVYLRKRFALRAVNAEHIQIS